MARHVLNSFLLFTALASVNGYWLMGIEDFITTERLDPIVNAGGVSGHVHSVLGGSNFRMTTNTANLRNSECTSIPIPEDKSSYWFPHLYFQWNNGSFTSLNGGAVIYYLFDDKPGTTTAFPDDFRMLSGTPNLRTYDSNSFAQQAITFLCLDFSGTSTTHNSLPNKSCPSGIRAQVNFPSCWDGKNLDSPDHKSHVAFKSEGPDKGTCSDPKFPVTLPRIFIEVYWASNDFDNVRSQAMDPSQPFVYSYGDPTGYGYHADFINGWDKGVLQKAVDNCHCNPYGDPTCCVDQGIFHMNKGQQCRITKAIDEQTTGTLTKLPGNNPVQKAGVTATTFNDPNTPVLLSPIYAYTGDNPTQVGKPVSGPVSSPSSPAGSSAPNAPPPSSSTSSVATTRSSPPVPPSSSLASPVSSSVATHSQGTSSPVPPGSALTSSISSPVMIHSQTMFSSAPSSSTSASSMSSSVVTHSQIISSPAPSSFTPVPPASIPLTTRSQSTPQPSSSSSVHVLPASSSSNPASSLGASPTSSTGGSHSASPVASPHMSSGCSGGHTSPQTSPSSTGLPHTSLAGSSSPTAVVPLPPSSGTGSNSPPYNVPVDGSSSHSSPSSPSPPSTTLVVGGGSGNGALEPAATGTSLPDTAPTCSSRKFRHKYLKDKKSQSQRRSTPYARRLLHSNGRRFMKHNAHTL